MRPLFHPAIEDIEPQIILHALADPNRAAILAKILTTGVVQACANVATLGDRVIPKSSLSNHIRVLREAGLIRSERHGVEMRNHSRFEEVNGRFPGLIAAIINAYAAGLPDEAESLKTRRTVSTGKDDGRQRPG
ncbi:ArsR family transcriptional regulator [Pseudomonas syringae pv. maculicola]|uniref:ArsR family transcriptional regulator n=1 Tax=Pseudomonas syringae pv. maculicola TaxID=59511 RepID=A0A0N1JHH7_PSEYM|nr:helix-turn-helix domain-containing protein [Pseudomonas syringae group genomosp. 3]KPC03376.1 ArsR family transcriptional regulator [Pseudomonas syringae pv. maculicola]MBM0213172.1 helix-turn-helix transcriptional regulator [Pseudomonas syringae pv. maculicola]PYD04363.1 ArsR family transcriptional regulator [Pseudomonas syringae pv. maculicola]RMM76192.1 ArsR family transcriptional regulator [Pseudomonas syringae pv. maculicola]RMV40518.1 ArsR family transcriptional regulator [Pseudomonas